MRRIKLLCVFAAAGVLALVVPASAGATTLIGSGSVAAQPVLDRAVLQVPQPAPRHQLHVHGDTAATPGSPTCSRGRSMFAGQARSPLPSDAGTTYIKMYLDGLCIDVNPGQQPEQHQRSTSWRIYHAHVTNWSPALRSSTKNDDRPDRTNQRRDIQLLPPGGPEQRPARVERQRADLRRPGRRRGQARQERDRLRRPRLARVRAAQGGQGQRQGVHAVADQEPEVPLWRYIYLVVPAHNPNQKVLKFADWARQSHVAGTIINKAGGVAAFNQGF